MNYKKLHESLMNNITRDIERLLLESSEDELFIINKSKLKTREITDPNELLKIIEDSVPDKETGHGFWLFDESIKKDENAYLGIKQPPFYLHYILYTYNGEPVALNAFSTQYYKKYDLTEETREYVDYIKLIDFQVDSRFRGNNIQKYCIDKMENIAKRYGYKGFTLMCYEPSLKEKYKRDGFLDSDNDENLMYKDFN